MMMTDEKATLPALPYVFVGDTRNDNETSGAHGSIRGGWFRRTFGRTHVAHTPKIRATMYVQYFTVLKGEVLTSVYEESLSP